MTTNHKIWPGPECLIKTRPLTALDVKAACAVVNARRALGFKLAAIAAVLPRSFAIWQDHQRTRGIAMGHVRARARMERFVAWLKDNSRHSSARSTAGFLSPEAWMEAQASSVHTWFRARLTALNVAPRWIYGAHYTPKRASALVVALLASPEWLSLPWQRESEGVGRG